MLKELEISSTNHRAIKAPLDCKVVKVLVHEGMKVEKDQPIFVVAVHPRQMTPLPMSECDKSRFKKFFDEESSRPGNFPIEDVLPDQNAGNSPMEPTFDSTVDVHNSYDNFKKFDFVVDHLDHLFSAQKFSIKYGLPPKYWIDKLNEDRRILCGHLPDTMFVRMYKSRPDLLRAAIVGPEGTPYHNGLFFFDFCFLFNYPNTPPDLIFNPNPLFNAVSFEFIKGGVDGKGYSQLYNENTIIKLFKTMVYTMNKPPKNFETLVARHFFKRARDILLECKDYMDGLQVGCLVSSSKCSSSIEFRNDLASVIKPLVNAFCKIGAKEALEFLYLTEKKTPLPEYDPISDMDPNHHCFQTFTAYCPFLVDMVLVKDGMNVKKGASFLYCELGLKELRMALSSTATKA